jgi:hypothetical protein
MRTSALFTLLGAALAEGTPGGVRRYTLVAKYSTFNADGAVLRKPLFNGSLPGPLLEANVDETLEITVVNAMTTDGLTLRTQPFAPEAQYDGTPGVSQVAIGPNGGSMVYKFNFTAPGTAHYHSGVGFQRETLFGPIVVKAVNAEPFDYHHEATVKSNDGKGAESPVVMLSDLYHVSTNELEAQLDNNIGDWIWAPQSSLVNGHGKYDCTTKHPYYFRCTWQCPVTDALCIDEVRCHGTVVRQPNKDPSTKDYLWEDDVSKNGYPGATWLAFNASHPQLVAANKDAWNARCTADHMLPWMRYHNSWAAGDFTELKDIGGSKFAVVDGEVVTPTDDEVHQSQFLNWGRPTGTLCNVSAATRDTRCAPDGTWRFKGINRDRIYDHLRLDNGTYEIRHYDDQDRALHNGATCRATKFYSGSVQPEGNHNPFGLWSQSRAQCNDHAQKANDAVGYPVMEVESGKTYRVRLVNMATLLYDRVVFEGHTMTLVEVDGEYVEPVELNFLDLWNGQTYSVLITANKSPKDYWVGGQTGHRGFTRVATHFVLRYIGNTDRLPNPSRPPPQAWDSAPKGAYYLPSESAPVATPKDQHKYLYDHDRSASIRGFFPDYMDQDESMKQQTQIRRRADGKQSDGSQLYTVPDVTINELTWMVGSMNSVNSDPALWPKCLDDYGGGGVQGTYWQVFSYDPGLGWQDRYSKFSAGTDIQGSQAACGQQRWAINNISYRFGSAYARKTPLLQLAYENKIGALRESGDLLQIKSAAEDSAFEPYDYMQSISPEYLGNNQKHNLGIGPASVDGTNMMAYPLNAVVDVVYQNTVYIRLYTNAFYGNKHDYRTGSNQHPYHVHGNNHFVIGMGEGTFDSDEFYQNTADDYPYNKNGRPYTTGKGPAEGKVIYKNLLNPARKNTIVNFAGGWVVARYKLSTPGIFWHHCQTVSHWHMGMGNLIAVGLDELATKPNPFEKKVKCGDLKTTYQEGQCCGDPDRVVTAPVAAYQTPAPYY